MEKKRAKCGTQRNKKQETRNFYYDNIGFREPIGRSVRRWNKKYNDSFGNLLKLKAVYGDKFEIEPMDNNTYNLNSKHWGKTYDNGEPYVITGHEGYNLYPFIKGVMKENDKGELEWNGSEEFVCIIPEPLRKTMKHGRYVLDKWENAVPSLANYAKNLDTGDIYVSQEMGGCGDIEYRFISDLIEMYNETLFLFDELVYFPGMEEMLPLCVKRIGYLKP